MMNNESYQPRAEMITIDGLTELPSSLHQSELRVSEKERDGPPQVVGVGLEVGIKDGDEVAVFGVALLEAFAKGARLVAASAVPELVLHVDSLARPRLALVFHHLLRRPRQPKQASQVSKSIIACRCHGGSFSVAGIITLMTGSVESSRT